MRHIFTRLPFSLSFVPLSLALGMIVITRVATAMPVYLTVQSPFPSGNYHRELLQARTKLSQQQTWVRVETLDHAFGWVAESELTKDGKDDRSFHPIHDHLALRSSPLPYADLIRRVQVSSHLSVLGKRQLHWGKVTLNDLGEVWWPMESPQYGNAERAPAENLSTAQLFSRKIFDMASSPAIHSLKFASAGGVYRTTDGEKWVKLPFFTDKNYPIAVAASGVVFVGSYLSEDQGETFQQWIRWDAVIASFRTRRPSAENIRLQEILPLGPDGRHLLVKLSIGHESIVRLITDDQGASWHFDSMAKTFTADDDPGKI